MQRGCVLPLQSLKFWGGEKHLITTEIAIMNVITVIHKVRNVVLW